MRANTVHLIDNANYFSLRAKKKELRFGKGISWRSLQESNLQLALRRGSLYPFN